MLTDWFLPNSLGVAIIWQMTACLLLALTASLIVATRPARAHGLVSVGLLACLIAPLLSAGVRTAGWGFFAQSPVSLPGDAAASTDTAEGVDPLASIEAFAGLAGMHAGSPQTDPPEAGSGNLMDLAVGGNRIQPAVANSGIDPWTTLFVGVWAAMTLVLAARLALGLRAARRLVLNAQPCTSAKVKRALDTAADRLGVEAQAELLCSDGLHSPVICSWGAVPRILLPRDCLDDLPIDDLTAILCHELAHWKRRDHWTTMLSEVVRCAWPWHPAVWLATARLRRLGEMACDDWVIASGHRRQRYARSLLSLTPQRGAVFAIAATHGRRGLANRIHRILGHPRRHPQAGVKWTTAVSIAALCVVAAASFAQRRSVAVLDAAPGGESARSGEAASDRRDSGGATIQREAWAKRIAELQGQGLGAAYHSGNELAALPPDEGYEILRENWPRISEVGIKQQMLKAWYYTMPYPLHPRMHPRILDVLHLGATDPAVQVQNWAFLYLKRIAFRDFAEDYEAYVQWYERNHRLPVEQVMVQQCRDFATQLAAAEGEQRTRLANLLGDLGNVFRDVESVRQAAIDGGILDTFERWLSEPAPSREVARAALRSVRGIEPGRDYMRRVVLPAAKRTDNADMQAEALSALGHPANTWAVDDLLEIVVAYLADDSAGSGHWFAAGALGEIGDPRAIPTLIAVIVADDTYTTVYGVGYFGLAKLTGVSYDDSHDGAWWRQWWQKNKARFPPEVRRLEVPKLVKERNARQDPAADEADTPAQDLFAAGDPNQRYFLIGPPDISQVPSNGFKVLLILPGGDGSADFLPFVKNMYRQALPGGYLVAQLVAPTWSIEQVDKIVWPTKTSPWPGMKFSTEQFVDGVIEDIKKRYEIDPRLVFTLSWSSGGPAAYATSLAPKTQVTGSFVAMSVFKLDLLPPLGNADEHAYYILHSPDDFIDMRFPEAARDRLAEHGAVTKLVTYEGGHGWHGDVYGMIRDGLRWLEETAAPR